MRQQPTAPLPLHRRLQQRKGKLVPTHRSSTMKLITKGRRNPSIIIIILSFFFLLVTLSQYITIFQEFHVREQEINNVSASSMSSRLMSVDRSSTHFLESLFYVNQSSSTIECESAKPVMAEPPLSTFEQATTNPSKQRPFWCLDVPVESRKNTFTNQRIFYLGLTAHVRIYKDDPAQLSVLDLLHWLTYHRYAGVQRVYLVDTYIHASERLYDALQPAVESGFVVYIDFHNVAYEFRNSTTSQALFLDHVQVPAYAAALVRARNETRWCGVWDIDEYAYLNHDTKPGFLARHLYQREQSEINLLRENGDIADDTCHRRVTTQYFLQNFGVHGRREYDRGSMLIQQVPRLDRQPQIFLFKPIVRLDAVYKHHIHYSKMLYGNVATFQANHSEPYTKHFKGGRLIHGKSIQELSEIERRELMDRTTSHDMNSLPEQVLQCF